MIETGDHRTPTSRSPTRTATPSAWPTAPARPVVLYFYPKADTPGCTVQACGVRDHLPNYAEAGAVVLGVSPDPVKAVKKFARQAVARLHAARRRGPRGLRARTACGPRSRCTGASIWGALRATFVIDPDGVVAHVIPRVTPKTHDDEVLAVLEQLAAA